MFNSNSYNPDVLTCIANLSSDEVFTPPQLVNQILDLLPAALWSDKNATFLDPGCKSGVFLREIAKRANHRQMLMAPHNISGPIGMAATLHADAATPNFLIQEMCPPYVANLDKYAEHDWRIADGYINVTDGPGLGLEVKEADIATMPHEPMAYRQYRHADGSWKGW